MKSYGVRSPVLVEVILGERVSSCFSTIILCKAFFSRKNGYWAMKAVTSLSGGQVKCIGGRRNDKDLEAS